MPVKKKKVINYKPPIKALVKRRDAMLAKDVDSLEKSIRERKVMRMVVRGQSYDQISQRLGISTKEAFTIAKSVIAKNREELTLDVAEAVQLELQRLDAVLALAMHEAHPHPMRDDFGQIVKVKTCSCEGNGKACLIDSHNVTAMTQPDIQWARMVDDISKRRSALLGLDAADKREQAKVDMLERVYTGVAPKVIEGL
jgi:DNA-binding CsgD family transcriptional regulator